MKSWKTTLIGVGSAAAYLIYHLLQHIPITGGDITIMLGMIGLGAAAKDSNVTGGSVKQ